MSRIGSKSVAIPKDAKHSFAQGVFTAEGPKGKQTVQVPDCVQLEIKDNEICFSRTNDSKYAREQHGLIRNLVKNALKGVTSGYQMKLEIYGVGFKAQMKGKVLNLNLGYSHEIDYQIPQGVTVTVPKPTDITVEGPDKVLVGRVAATIRDYYRPEPYKGKGVRYAGENIRRKQGKVVG